MIIVYAKISELLPLEIALPANIEELIEVHIVSDLAWESVSGELSVVCDIEDYNNLNKIISNVVIIPMEKNKIISIKRTYGC